MNRFLWITFKDYTFTLKNFKYIDYYGWENIQEKTQCSEVLEAVFESTINETAILMKNDDEQTRQTLKSFQEVLKRKLGAVKTLVVK